MTAIIRLNVSLRVFDGVLPFASAKQKGHILSPGDYEVKRVPNPYDKEWPDWYALSDRLKVGLTIGGAIEWWESFGTNVLEIRSK